MSPFVRSGAVIALDFQTDTPLIGAEGCYVYLLLDLQTRRALRSADQMDVRSDKVR